jgi:hypothetical protein
MMPNQSTHPTISLLIHNEYEAYLMFAICNRFLGMAVNYSSFAVGNWNFPDYMTIGAGVNQYGGPECHWQWTGSHMGFVQYDNIRDIMRDFNGFITRFSQTIPPQPPGQEQAPTEGDSPTPVNPSIPPELRGDGDEYEIIDEAVQEAPPPLSGEAIRRARDSLMAEMSLGSRAALSDYATYTYSSDASTSSDSTGDTDASE